MKQNKYLLNTVLAVVLFIALVVVHIVRVVIPAAVLPVLNIPNIVLLSMVALLVDHWISPRTGRNYIFVLILSVITFAVLPLIAGFACQHDFWKFGLVGGIVFTVCTWLFSSVTQRLVTGPKARAAAVISAFGIYLAAQCFAGIIL